jgi:hypothetical protein
MTFMDITAIDHRTSGRVCCRATRGLIVCVALALVVSYADRAAACQPLVTGAFVQLDTSLAGKSSAWWQSELNAMAAIGMDTVIVQYVALDNTYYYPTSISGGTPFGTDSIERILDAADENSMEVFLGMHLDTGQFTSGNFDLNANLQQGQATLQELANRYGSHPSLAGWYGPQEVSDFIALDGSQTQLRNDLTSYIHDMASLGRSSAGLSLPTLISPYFGENPNAVAYAQWWDTQGLPQMGVDIFALQDGVGTHRTTLAQSQQVFQAIAPVVANHGVNFWANNESFNQIHGYPVDGQPFQAIPTDVRAFIDQISATAPLTEKSVAFEFSHYFSPQHGSAAQSLYADYKNYYQAVTTNLIPISSYAYDNASTASFHPSAGDPTLSRLTDGNDGSLQDGVGSAFANGTWVGFGDNGPSGGPQPGIVLDLGGLQAVESVEVTYLVDASSFIFSPQAIPGVTDALSILTSTDGTTFASQSSTSDFVEWSTDLSNEAFEVRTITLALSGIAATHLKLDVRTPNTWIFLGEIRVFEQVAAADFNADGAVDGNDLLIWQVHYGTSSDCGDADGDGQVTGSDFLIWQRQFSVPSSMSSSVMVPEPHLAFTILPLIASLKWAVDRHSPRQVLGAPVASSQSHF